MVPVEKSRNGIFDVAAFLVVSAKFLLFCPLYPDQSTCPGVAAVRG